MKLPAKIKVGYAAYSCEVWLGNKARGNLGETDLVKHTMRIRLEDVALAEIANTLLHEIFHAIYSVFHVKNSDLEEEVVAKMSTGFQCVLQDNPALVKWLVEYLKRAP